jgi:hypothetical protein
VTFTDRLKAALVGDRGASFVFLGNVEVERHWAVGETGLPQVGFAPARAVVNRMDELAVPLAGDADHVVVSGTPDPGYLACLARLGLTSPQVVAAAPRTVTGTPRDGARGVTEEALATPRVLRRLSALAADGAWLLPHGVSTWEERLAERTGMRLAVPPAEVCKHVNSKVYGRRLATRLGLRQPAGWACASLEELAGALEGARELLADGRRVVVKDAFGVSGQGMVVTDDPGRLDRLHRMMRAQIRRTGGERIGLVVEEWVARATDLNYQFTVGRDATVHFDFVKEMLTERGVHAGHRMPARLDQAHLAELRRCAGAIGRQLAADGYYGVVGVDAMIDVDGVLYPVVEINARNNMSTYQATLGERVVGPGMTALARHYPLRPATVVTFGRLRHALGDLLLSRAGDTGLAINAFATVNAGGPGYGRLYGLVVAESFDQLAELDAEITHRLAVVDEQ